MDYARAAANVHRIHFVDVNQLCAANRPRMDAEQRGAHAPRIYYYVLRFRSPIVHLQDGNSFISLRAHTRHRWMVIPSAVNELPRYFLFNAYYLELFEFYTLFMMMYTARLVFLRIEIAKWPLYLAS